MSRTLLHDVALLVLLGLGVSLATYAFLAQRFYGSWRCVVIECPLPIE